MNNVEMLTRLIPEHDYLIAIDSDGCVFDTMEIKHKECFIPNIIKSWDLQAISKYVRSAAEYVNLYSKWRGVNRFPALVKVFDLLKEWPEVQKRQVIIPRVSALRDWIKRETKLSNLTLKAEVDRTGDQELKTTLEWSVAVNDSVLEMVHGVPPFPNVRASLSKISDFADIIVCSATPGDALVREWKEHKIDRNVKVIAGQELGSKAEHIKLATAGKYNFQKILMIGDAPGDLIAARANKAKFYPINPGSEEESWREFLSTALERFINGEYNDDYEAQLINNFEQKLPETPPWLAKDST
ncbi:MAG: HAD family hydrolase [Candidatus Neomarinimicrobiota bacterium]